MGRTLVALCYAMVASQSNRQADRLVDRRTRHVDGKKTHYFPMNQSAVKKDIRVHIFSYMGTMTDDHIMRYFATK